MRVLVVGAGALGGYFGGRLAEAGRDVSFLVRPAREEQLVRDGLRIRSQHGDADLRVRTVRTGAELGGPYDLILLTVKSHALDRAIADMAPAVAEGAAILPVLNGMRHLDRLTERFGRERVLGGLSIIAATLDWQGRVVQAMVPNHDIVFGELEPGPHSARVRRITALFEGARCAWRASEDIVQDMWEKWAGMAATSGLTCLMRASVGDVLETPGGQEAALALWAEAAAVAAAHGHAPRPAFRAMSEDFLTRRGSTLTASMLRDIEAGSETEGEHILGDLVERARAAGVATPILDLARCHVAAYAARRKREREAAA